MAERLVVNGRYEIKDPVHDRIGEGGMGTVYQGVDLQTGEKVAIKHLKPHASPST